MTPAFFSSFFPLFHDEQPVGLHLKIQTTSDHPPTLNSSVKKGDVETTSTIDTTPIINKGNSVKMTGMISEVPKSSTYLTENTTPTILSSLGGPFAKTAETAAIVNDDNNAISSNASSSSSRPLKNDSNFNSANSNSETGDGFGKSSTDFINILLPFSEESSLESQTANLSSLESPTSINSNIEETNCFFGALFRRRGKMRHSHNQGNGISNGGGGIGRTRHNSCRAFNGFKALSKCKRGGGGMTSINRSSSLLEPIAGAGCDFACSSLPSSGAPSHRPSMVAGDMTCSDLDDTITQISNNHQQVNQPRKHYFRDLFTVPPTFSNGKAAACKNKDCYRKCGSISCCSPVKCLSTPFPITSTGIEATTTECRCQNRLMLNITTMITNNCNNRQANLNSNTGDLPLGSSNLSLIAINSNTDGDKQTLDGKMINGCCNLESGCVNGKIPVCWATTTTNTYNNSNNLTKLSSGSSCANCNNLMNNKNMQNNFLHSTGEKNLNSSKSVSKKSNGLSFNFRNRASSQESATLQAKCKCTIKEGMSRTTGGCMSCSKCVIL